MHRSITNRSKRLNDFSTLEYFQIYTNYNIIIQCVLSIIKTYQVIISEYVLHYPATFYTNNVKDVNASLNVLLNKGLKGLVLFSE